MPRPLTRQSFRLGVAERMDVIVDFSSAKLGDTIYLQNRMDRRHFFGGILGAAGMAISPSPSRSEGDRGESALTAAERRRRFVNVLLRIQDDKEVRFYDDPLKDKTVLINFMYTNCTDDCTLTTATLAQVQKLLGPRVGRDIFMYSISVDPAHDTPRILRQYAQRFGVKPGWLFLTGAKEGIQRIRGNFGDDPTLDFRSSDHLNLIEYGIERLERWAGFPAWTKPETMV